MNINDELKSALQKDAIKYGDFTLASGKKSKFYINCKTVTLDAKGSYLIGKALLNLIPKECEAVGGLTLGADPIISSITVISHIDNRPVKGFIVRKEAKGHGTESQIENPPKKGAKVVIVDDVITTGGSALKAAKIAKEAGMEVILALSIVDRCEGGEAAFKEIGVPMKSVFKINELLQQ